MLRDKSLAVNTALLTASGLAMRFVGMIWQVWLVSRIGEAGIGLFQLIMSVSTLAATVAISGIRFTTTRLVSEETGLDRPHGAAQGITACLLYGLFFGLAAGLILMLIAEPVGFLWLGDARTVRPLMLLALEMPLTGIDSVMHGYFTAVGRVWKSVCIAILQQAATIIVTALLLMNVTVGNLEASCLIITLGRLAGSLFELVCMMTVFILDMRRHHIRKDPRSGGFPAMTNRMLTIALPIAAAAYARSGLSTLQHLLVPKGLRASGLTAETALAGYGVIQGMALPVVLFPSCVMLAVAELIVPKLTQKQMQGNHDSIRLVSAGILYKGLIFSAITAALFLALGESFGLVIYDSQDAGAYIQLFALIVPVMYLDMLTDGCLKGLGQMMFCMVVNIADAGVSALMVWLMLPKWGLGAYIFIICFTETFNFLLSFLRLRKITSLRIPIRKTLWIFFWAFLSAGAGRLLNNTISAGDSAPALILSVIAALVLYGLGVILPEAEAGKRASVQRYHRCW